MVPGVAQLPETGRPKPRVRSPVAVFSERVTVHIMAGPVDNEPGARRPGVSCRAPVTAAASIRTLDRPDHSVHVPEPEAADDRFADVRDPVGARRAGRGRGGGGCRWAGGGAGGGAALGGGAPAGARG